MLKWLRSIDWSAIFASALVLVIALWFLAANPNYNPYPAAYKNPFEYIFGWLSPEAWTALFTCALFISTLALWRVTRQSVETANRALTELERPYIFAWGIELKPQGGSPPRLFYHATNGGKLAAVIENISIRFGVEHEGQFPPIIIIGDHPFLRAPILSMNEDTSAIYDVPQSATEYGIPVQIKDSPIFQVVITYRGPFTKGHETAQCWRYRQNPRGFIEVSDPHYTYTR